MIQPYSFTVINEQYVKAACDFMSQAALIYPPLLQRQFYRIRGLLRRFMPAELVTQLIQPRGFLLELVLLRPGFTQIFLCLVKLLVQSGKAFFMVTDEFINVIQRVVQALDQTLRAVTHIHHAPRFAMTERSSSS